MLDKTNGLEKLTFREQEILDMLLKGISPKDIAYKLDISYSTVDFHCNKMYRKLGVKSIHELYAKYSNAGQYGSASQDNSA